MKTSESIAKIAPDLLKAQQSMGDASKGASNPFFKSKYADLNAVREAGIPPLNANNISVLQPTVVENGKQYIETILIHTSGEFMSSLTEVIIGKANNAQDAGSGISYARRYGLQSFLNIGAVDDDGEKTMGRETLNKQAYTAAMSNVPVGATSATTNQTLTSNTSLPLGAVQSALEPLKKTSFSRKGKKTEVPATASAMFTPEELSTPKPTEENWG
jgi:hypothetical protein